MPTDTERLDWLTLRDAFVAWTREGEHCRVFYREEEDFEPICGWPVFFDDARSAIDAAMMKVQNGGANSAALQRSPMEAEGRNES